MARPRIYLTGRVILEHGERRVDERDLPGRQGRLAFVYLTLHRTQPVSRSEIAEVLWRAEEPEAIDSALNAIVSKLRGVLKRAGLVAASLETRSGALDLRLPDDTWVDLEEAAHSIDVAEGALRGGDMFKAWGLANVAVSITRRPFLPEFEAPWIAGRRETLQTLSIRALECLAQVSHQNGEVPLAIQYTSEVLEMAPFRETAYQQLMRLHAGAGNRAEALRVFQRCRQRLRDELGTSPSPQTTAVFNEILRG